MSESEYKIPKDASNYTGEFIVFFSDEEDPQVLFHSLIPAEAYTKAREVEKEKGKIPIVIRVTDSADNLERLLLLRK